MLEQDIGFLPIAHNERLVGALTDRDIVLRVIAEGRDPAETPVSEVMTPGAKYCYADEDAGHVIENMAEIHVSRLPVMDRQKRLVGVVSLDNLMPQRPHANGDARAFAVQP
jgi:CBS domain-containing protein